MADDGTRDTLWIDVSHHDWTRRGGNLDWARVLEATSPVMCARATYGDPAFWYRNSFHFGDFQRAAAAAGFDCRGGYHNLVRGDAASMRRQVDWLRRELDAYGCTWGMADVERYPELLSASMWPRYEDVLRFRDAWVAAEDRVLMWYIPRWVWSYWGSGADLRVLPGPLNQSHYLTGIYGGPREIYDAGGASGGTGWDDCYGGRCPEVWQYSATCTCPGASDRTDVNAYRGTLDQLRALLGGGAMNEDYGAAGPPPLIDGRKRDVLVADLWGHEMLGVGPYGDGAISPRTKQLMRIEAKLDQMAAPRLTDEDRKAIAALLAADLKPAIDQLRLDVRDAVADLGEGGAAAVRADES